MKKSLLPFLLFLSLFLAASSFAGQKRFAAISQDDLANAIAEQSVTVIDVNGTNSYKKGHIPGAIDYQSSQKDLAGLLPEDKASLIVAYCANEACGAYQRAAKAAVELGYTNVAHYPGGLQGWKRSGADVETVKDS
ncbi:MAG: rhodanese-like domain-containing protein [Opitutaceae bacterium]|nr:rhodanese-like domain-containing protein [Opitutaceae bacterium]